MNGALYPNRLRRANAARLRRSARITRRDARCFLAACALSVRLSSPAGSLAMLVSPTFFDRSRTQRLPGPLVLRAFASGGRLLAAIVFAAALPGRVHGTTANDLCAMTANPCRVSSTVNVTSGSVIDVGTRRLLITGQGALEVGGGTMTLRAADLLIEANGRVRARGNAADEGGRIIIVANRVTINGTLDASGAPGGEVTLTSMGPLLIAGPFEVRSLGNEASGGTADVQGTDITVSSMGRINAVGGAQDFGGAIDLRASGAMVISGALTASGGEGGDVDLTAAGALTLNSNGSAIADATATGGGGGDISFSANGALILDGHISAQGRNGSDETGGGDGGSIAAFGLSITGTRTMQRTIATAGGPDGIGGDVELTSSAGAIDFRGEIDVRASGTEGSGGTVSVDAVGMATLGGPINADGGGDGGGDVEVSSGVDLTVLEDASLSASASSIGPGGNIDVSAGGDVEIFGELTADGGPQQGGVGGTVFVSGCTVRIEESGRLNCREPGGANTLTGRDLTIVAGRMRADSSGQNVILFAGPDYEPVIIPGADIDPAASQIEDSSIIPCNPINTRTPTPSRTPNVGTPTRTGNVTRTPTATPNGGGCVGDCDGNGMVTINDLILGVNIALGFQPVSACPAFDPDGGGTVTVDELIQGVNNALNGCA